VDKKLFHLYVHKQTIKCLLESASLILLYSKDLCKRKPLVDWV
jgi:hypothetical protein